MVPGDRQADWRRFRKAGEKEIKKLLGVEEPKKASMWPKLDLGITPEEAFRAPFQHPGEAKPNKDQKNEKLPRFLMTPMDKERADAIHLKISKIAFEATLRFMYVEKREGAVDSGHTNSIHGFIRQFNTQNLNSLKPDSPTSTASWSVKDSLKRRAFARGNAISMRITGTLSPHITNRSSI